MVAVKSWYLVASHAQDAGQVCRHVLASSCFHSAMASSAHWA